MTRPRKRSANRQRFLVGASLLALPLSTTLAQSPFVKRPDGAAQAARAAQNSAANAVNSQAIAKRSLEAFVRAALARSAAESAQAAARAAAASSQAALNVPNGLTEGGLKVANAVVFDTGAITGADDPKLATPNLWIGARAPTQAAVDGKTNVTIEQTQQKAILSWETFNVGKDTTVHFDQRGGGTKAAEWVALNRVTDPNGNPSRIFGNIKAEGQVYLLNRNGVVFGGTSQVNVHSIVASSLDFHGDTLAARNKRFADGILFNPNDTQRAALVFGEKLEASLPPRSPSDPNPQIPEDVKTLPGETFADGDGVTVASGAVINATGGRAMIVGHTVINDGTIAASDGEVVLAAGRGIYLNKNYPRGAQPATVLPDPDIRGITVGVNRGGRVENRGIISSKRGSVNIQGKSIEQNGLLEVTTSATKSGYINIAAADGLDFLPGVPYPAAARMGELRFGPGSTTQILPDDNGEKAVGLDQFKQSRIELRARTITFEKDSTVFAPSATMLARATRDLQVEYVVDPVTGEPVVDPDNPAQFLRLPDDGRIVLEAGARIDLSGIRDIDVEMTRNSIQGEVRANELKSNPVLRTSFLRGRKVYFDARKGTAVADLSGYYDLMQRDVREFMTEGGSLQLIAPDVATRSGSTIDLSGGSLNYRGGFVRSTLLLDRAGNVVRIEDAKAGVDYVGFYGDRIHNHVRWGVKKTYYSPFARPEGRFEAGYLEGRSAGALTIGETSYDYSHSQVYGQRSLEGDVVADIVVGQNQREAPNNATIKDVARVWRERPRGATLTMGYRFDPGPGVSPIYSGGSITVAQEAGGSTAYNHVLPARYFDGKTFSIVNLYSGRTGLDSDAPAGNLTIDKNVTFDLGDYGRLNFFGTSADIEGSIRAAGGAININAVSVGNSRGQNNQTDWSTLDESLKPRIHLGDVAVLDVSGRWMNDYLDGAERALPVVNGGSVSLITSYDLQVAQGALIDVSGGGRLATNGKTLTMGDAGSIALVNSHKVYGSAGPAAAKGGAFDIDGTLRGYALGRGGSLTLATDSDIVIGNQPLPPREAPVPAPDGEPQAEPPASSTLQLAPEYFAQGGFAQFNITGSGGITLQDNTLLAPQVESYVLDDFGRSFATGTRLHDAARREIQTGRLTQAMSLTLSNPWYDVVTNGVRLFEGNIQPGYEFAPGSIAIGTGSEIRMAPESTVRLRSARGVFIDGTITTPGGSIDVGLAHVPLEDEGATPAVRLGSNARLLARGYQRDMVDRGLVRRTVEDGGRVAIDTFVFPENDNDSMRHGYVMTDAGSVIDVSGVRGTVDLDGEGSTAPGVPSRYVERTVDGHAGSVTIYAGGGGVLAGQLLLAPGGEGGRGGRLDIGVKMGSEAPERLMIDIAQHLPDAVDPVTLDSQIDPAMRRLSVYADLLNNSRADHLSVAVDGTASIDGGIIFDGDVSLATRRSIRIGAPYIARKAGAAGNVEIASQYVRLDPRIDEIKPFASAKPVTPLATQLEGSFTVRAGMIDVRYGSDFGCGSPACAAAGLDWGFEDVRLISAGDIRLDGPMRNGAARIATGGTLTLDAAQVYVTSRSIVRTTATDAGFLLNAGKSINIVGNGAAAPVPYSAGERLTLRAPEIVQGGVLRAPMGEIRFEATKQVTLAPGSLTSTSLEGLVVPLGLIQQVDVQSEFRFLMQNNEFARLVTKKVTLTAPDVTVQEGAVIDASGGGDVAKWMFVQGNSGSNNILREPGMFAILPSWGDRPTPTGTQQNDANVGFYTTQPPRVGDKVYLEGIQGLRAGEYTLLPVDYALLDGALLVRPQGGSFAQAPPTVTRPDGSSLVGGYRISGGVADTGYSRFQVMSHKTFDQYSEFVMTSFNEFVTTRATLAEIRARTGHDAGTVTLGATRNLILEGSGKLGAPKGGLLGNLDVSAQKIAITNGSTPPPEGFLAISGKALSQFGAGSIFIGGTRAQAETGTTLNVTSTEILVANDAASVLSGPEVLIGARNKLTIDDGAVIASAGEVITDTNPLLLTGNGALVRATTGDRVDILRTNANGSAGVLDVGALAQLSAAGSLSLDASRTLLLDPAAVFAAGQLDLSSVKVSIGDVPDTVTGTILSGATLENLGKSTDLLIRGVESIDLYGSFAIGGRNAQGAATLGALTFDTARLDGIAAAGDTATITAGSITLRNSGAASGAGLATTAGTLALDADKLILGPGEIDVTGFERANARTGVLQGKGLGGLDFAGTMAVTTDLVTAEAESDYGMRIGGDLSIVRAGGAAQSAQDFGGRFAVSGRNVLLDAKVDLPSGVFEAAATGGDLTLGSSAAINAQGNAVTFRDVVRATSGGIIKLSATGNVSAAQGSSLTVSGHERGGNAGWVEVDAGGSTAMGGTITGTAAAGYRGGGFLLDAGSVADFASLNATLEAGRMTAVRAIHVQQGDLVLASDQAINAHDALLRSDAGGISIAGSINAAGTAVDRDGGTIRLIGGNGVSLAGTARLDARAGATAAGNFEADSGSVEFAAIGGRVNIAQGAVVDVSGGKQGGGKVLIRAARVGNDIAIDRIDATFTGARDLGIAGVQSYQTTTVDAVLRDSMLADAAAWMQNAAAIQSRLGNPAFEIRPGISAVSGGDLTIAADINLAGARYDSTAGHLDFVAAGDINVDAAISDGFTDTTRTAALLSGRSWSYGFEARGDVKLGAGQLVRTGTGDIRVDAGRDLVFVDNLSNLYTAGSRTATQAGFVPIAGRVTGEFPTLGGDISLTAGRDILAPVTQQATSAWLFRYGDSEWTGDVLTTRVVEQASWSIVFANFEQSVGALGGGNVEVNAGRDVSQLAVALPTTGHMTTAVGGVARAGDVAIRGGGDLTLVTGRDLEGGVFHLGSGQAEVIAGGRLTYGDTLVAQRTADHGAFGYAPRTLAALFGLQDASLTVSARAGVEIEAVYDPMMQGQICENSLCQTTGLTLPVSGSAFYGMTERTAVSAITAGGDVRYNGNPWASVDVSRDTARAAISIQDPFVTDAEMKGTTTDKFKITAGTMKLVAMQKDVVIGNRYGSTGQLQLAPTDNGTLELLAAKALRADTSNSSGLMSMGMAEIGKDYRRGALHPFLVTGDTRMILDINQPGAATNFDRGFTLTHVDDRDPARVYALTDSLQDISVGVPKPLFVYSGKDLSGTFTAQNNNAGDWSSFVAERDTNDLQVIMGGVGNAFVEAGRHLQLGAVGGVYSTGQFIDSFRSPRSRNLALPENESTNIYMLAGAAKQVDYAGFAAAYLDPDNAAGVVRTYGKELADYMRKLGYTEEGDADLLARFQALPIEARKVFVQQVFFSELKETGLDATDPKSPRFQKYERGYDAIERLFTLDTTNLPEDQRANMLLNAKRVETSGGGSITLLAPYGRVEIGGRLLANVKPEDGGVITRKGGDIRIMADKNINLFSSRVFTLQGGDVTMWSSNGDITAGAGAKTTVFRPPLIYSISNDGLVSLNVFGLQTGAGIGVLDAGGTGERKRSRMDLIAPRGEVNAGDAGIRVVGDINIAALRVVGLDNIQVTGKATGLPEVAEANVGALTAASSASSAVSQAAASIAQRNNQPAAREIPSLITSRFLGFGEEEQ